MNDGLTTIIKLEREPIKSRDRTQFIPWNPTSKNKQRMPRIDHFFEGLTIQVLIDHEPKSPSF
jgi:hypothetical protein